MTKPHSPARRGRRGALVLYILLLVASAVVRQFQGPPDLRPGQEYVQLPPVVGDVSVPGRDIRMAFTDSGPPEGEAAVPAILIHGSPMASPAMMSMHRALSLRGYRVLTPDLPGLGRSTTDVPDYSVRAHARYLINALDSLNLSRAHLVAYSMGGGVALEVARLAPDRVASIVMLSAIGVQELELTGDYYLNHAIHGIQLAGLWLVREAIPHFGYLDDTVLGVSYARNFFDTDQRPLRGILSEYRGPMQIVHGRTDPLVPYQAALEHARLVPQSELVTLEEGGHSLPFTAADSTAGIISSFLGRVDSGAALSRSAAAPSRVRAAAEPFDPSSIPPPGGFAVVILMALLAVATFASEDLASIGAGLMAARGTLTFLQATLGALAGIVIGDVGLYIAGRWLGHPMVRRAPFRWFIKEEKLLEGEKWFAERGVRAVLIARFVPGTRLPTYVAAGVLKAPFWRFFSYFMVAALIWTPAIVGLSMIAGNQILEYYESFERYAVWVVLGTAIGLLLALRFVVPAFTHAGRRRLKGAWLRFRRWEFWPPWIFYPPVILYAVWLGIRHRSLLAFTAANPAIPHSGFIGESKQAILKALPPESVANWRPITAGSGPEAAVSVVGDFLQSASTAYPIVLKPDVGERGTDVVIARSDADVRAYFEIPRGATIGQVYVPGEEFGVFFVRDPRSGKGEIFSITDKRFPAVTGDGRRTVANLILDDDRTVAMHAIHEQANQDRLGEIPADGETVQLVELGTHCRGAVFLDGSQLHSPALTTSVTRIADAYPGFHFGRFDVRTPSARHLQEGIFTVIELNGVTSEATHIYHPGAPLLSAYRALFRQWAMAYRIGAANRRAGAETSSPFALLKLLLRHFAPISSRTAGSGLSASKPSERARS